MTTEGLIIQTVVTLGGVFIAGVGMLWRLNQKLDDMQAVRDRKIEEVRKDNDSKVSRSYERFDEFKKAMELSHVRVDVCAIVHEQVSKNFEDLKQRQIDITTDIKEILKEVRNGKKQGA
jgi:hypothetical protein